ncbi:uncharacterized protein LOC141716705 isoform X5 [Apium graveolens]|uniref:uncharacterized protein LOC141716705 isoform X5 n=1 Tax=Apium graveolens TaxID=4045 RepID=UPI003D792DD7
MFAVIWRKVVASGGTSYALVFGKSVHLAISNPRLCDNALGEEVPTDFQFYAFFPLQKKKHITPADLAKFYICMPVSSHSGGKSV